MIPVIYESTKNGTIGFDIYSRLLKDRIVFIGEEIVPELANSVIAQMLFLEAEDSKKDITLYINSPGGHVTAGLAIYDTMNHIKCDVSTICAGMAASMGAFLLSGGTKGKRFSLPNSEIMIHQPSGGAHGQATDIAIRAELIRRDKNNLTQLLANHTGKSFQQVWDACERDNFMSPAEALDFGLIDKIL